MKTGAIIQARTSSTRLPQKVLKELPFGSGITVLQQVIRRVRKARSIDEIIVATSTEESDDEIVQIAKKERAKFFRGSLNDVLERYYLAAKENRLGAVVRITSDCPCIDPEVLDLAVNKHRAEMPDYTSNVLKRSYPGGLDVEVVSFGALERIYRGARDEFEREHPTFYIHQNLEMFKIVHIEAGEELHAPHIRITLDTEEDYVLLCAIFDELYPQYPYFGAGAIIKLFHEKPWLYLMSLMNAKTCKKALNDENDR